MEQDKNTEQRIIEAAQKIFQTKGLAGARMQEIADTAGINKAMLHYYFRTKDKLFDHIFRIAAKKIFPRIANVISSELPLEDKISKFAVEYIDFIKEHPFLPLFIMQELSNNNERLMEIMAEAKSKYKLKLFQQQIDDEVAKGAIRPIKAEHLIVNILSMVIFPFAGKAIIQFIMGKTDEEFAQFIEERKTLVVDFILNAIRV